METGTKLDLFPAKIPFYREDRDTTVPVTQCNELCIVTKNFCPGERVLMEIKPKP
jgi:hypothetical protein